MRLGKKGQWYKIMSGIPIRLDKTEQFKKNQQTDKELKKEIYKQLNIEYKPDNDDILEEITKKIVSEKPYRDRLIQYQKEEMMTMASEQKPLQTKYTKVENQAKGGENSIEMIDYMFNAKEFKGKKERIRKRK